MSRTSLPSFVGLYGFCKYEAALRLCEQNTPQIAVLDGVMPKLGGTAPVRCLCPLLGGEKRQTAGEIPIRYREILRSSLSSSANFSTRQRQRVASFFGAARFSTTFVLWRLERQSFRSKTSWRGDVVLVGVTFMLRGSRLGTPQYICGKSRDKPTGNDDPFPRQAGSQHQRCCCPKRQQQSHQNGFPDAHSSLCKW